MQYQEPLPISREKMEQAINTGDSRTITNALISIVLNDSDRQWVQAQCIRLADYPDAAVRGLVATCFGHLARLHRAIDEELVLPVLKRLLHDPVTEVVGQSEDALGDFEVYLGWSRARRKKFVQSEIAI